jgi:hypothetical protein
LGIVNDVWKQRAIGVFDHRKVMGPALPSWKAATQSGRQNNCVMQDSDYNIADKIRELRRQLTPIGKYKKSNR